MPPCSEGIQVLIRSDLAAGSPSKLFLALSPAADPASQSLKHARTRLLRDHLLFAVPRKYLLDTCLLPYCPQISGSFFEYPIEEHCPSPLATPLPPHPSPSVTLCHFLCLHCASVFLTALILLGIIFICLNLPHLIEMLVSLFCFVILGTKNNTAWYMAGAQYRFVE